MWCVARYKLQWSGCTSIGPETGCCSSVCCSLHLHPQHLNRHGALRIRVAFHYIPTKEFWFSKTWLVGLQSHVFVSCLHFNSSRIYSFIWRKIWLSLCWSLWFSETPPQLSSPWGIVAVCDGVLIRERTSPRTCVWVIFQRNLSTPHLRWPECHPGINQPIVPQVQSTLWCFCSPTFL